MKKLIEIIDKLTEDIILLWPLWLLMMIFYGNLILHGFN